MSGFQDPYGSTSLGLTQADPALASAALVHWQSWHAWVDVFYYAVASTAHLAVGHERL